MLNECVLTETLADLGYERVKPLVYKICGRGGILEHFLKLTVWGPEREFLAVDFSFRERHAQDFGIECVRLYGGDIYGALQYDQEVGCSMSFSLGRWVGWKPRGSLRLTTTSMDTISTVIESSLQERVVPIIRELNDQAQLLSVLVRDSEPFRWAYVNGAIRAAQIVFLASDKMVHWQDIELLLAPFKRQIWANLGKGKDPDSFVNDVRVHYHMTRDPDRGTDAHR